MSGFSLNEKMNIKVKMSLIAKGSDEPLSGNRYKVRLYDKDLFNDDFLGESALDDKGVAKFIFTEKDFSGFANLDDKPDFYFVIYRNENEIFKSRIIKDLDLHDVEKFRMKEGEVIDLGTFLIDA